VFLGGRGGRGGAGGGVQVRVPGGVGWVAGAEPGVLLGQRGVLGGGVLGLKVVSDSETRRNYLVVSMRDPATEKNMLGFYLAYAWGQSMRVGVYWLDVHNRFNEHFLAFERDSRLPRLYVGFE